MDFQKYRHYSFRCYCIFFLSVTNQKKKDSASRKFFQLITGLQENILSTGRATTTSLLTQMTIRPLSQPCHLEPLWFYWRTVSPVIMCNTSIGKANEAQLPLFIRNKKCIMAPLVCLKILKGSIYFTLINRFIVLFCVYLLKIFLIGTEKLKSWFNWSSYIKGRMLVIQ